MKLNISQLPDQNSLPHPALLNNAYIQIRNNLPIQNWGFEINIRNLSRKSSGGIALRNNVNILQFLSVLRNFARVEGVGYISKHGIA